MRAVVQRTGAASVTVAGETIADVGPGLTVLLGVGAGDGEQDARYLAEKIVNLRIFPDQEGKMNLSLLDTGGELLVVSQFTLYGDCRKGRRPGFDAAAPPAEAVKLYEFFLRLCRETGVRTASGRFQAEMIVKIENQGPVTILLDSSRLF
ncbi:MAG: D-aminoacyl-tRNA deacylase [Negativicutes bacterium]|nr:D-aminoacyl-tRNA deacylase [Negativicutes bacterium]